MSFSIASRYHIFALLCCKIVPFIVCSASMAPEFSAIVVQKATAGPFLLWL